LKTLDASMPPPVSWTLLVSGSGFWFLVSAFCLLPSAFCLLPSAFCGFGPLRRVPSALPFRVAGHAAESQDRYMPENRMRLTIALLCLVLITEPLSAWELASKTLPERAKDVDVIVVAKLGTVHSRRPSLIMGLGHTWLVTLRVSKTLKGNLPVKSRVTFSEVAVEDWPMFRSDQERVWLLKKSPDPGLFAASAAYESVLLASQEPKVRAALQALANPSTHP
jgi:hypothetical protein